MNILITSIGRRVQLIEHLKNTFTVIGVDASEHNAAQQFVDRFYLVPRCDEDNYIERLLDICGGNDVQLIIPLYEREFDKLCSFRDRFYDIGTRILLSDTEVIKICNDKYSTQKFFKDEQIMSPKLTTHAPAVIKPVDGMGSQGIYIVDTDEELNAAKVLSKGEVIVQEKITGVEYTIDVLCDFDGGIASVVPRIREEVRSGEVAKSRTEHNESIINATKNLIVKLNKYGKVVGPITVQCFLTDNNEVIFIEINPRFGGGVPLTFEAGVNYGKIIEGFVEGKTANDFISTFKDISMMRYDMAVYININKI